jgi:nucleotide-binding universal stress UspA family protein
VNRPILLASDGSPSCAAATDEALRIASLVQAPLVVLTVGRANGGWRAVEQRAAAAAVACSTVVADGDPADQICHRAGDARLVVLGTHGRGPLGRLVYGSVSERVLRRCDRPVLVVQEG